MRRWFALFLFVMLPLQFTWTAVAAYCAHEGPAAAAHVGLLHHGDGNDHAHGGFDVGPEPEGEAPGPHADHHHHCHGHCMALVDATVTAPVHGAAHARPLPPDPGAAEHVATPPERPQWARLA